MNVHANPLKSLNVFNRMRFSLLRALMIPGSMADRVSQRSKFDQGQRFRAAAPIDTGGLQGSPDEIGRVPLMSERVG